MAAGVCIFLIFLNLSFINCHNIVGCGGFVKSDIKGFSFQKLSANLIFPDGTVNYITDILPNGAYSIPVYDYGEYVLKVVGPPGWNIEPSAGFRLLVDGQDSCSADYNFKFTGFSVYGKVSTANIDHGQSGILIDLIKDGNIIAYTRTVQGGEFVIDKVLPGKYYLNINSKTSEGKIIELTETKYDIEISDDNVIIKDSFIIHGYPVFGDVHFQNEPVSGVEFFLYSKLHNAENFNFTKYNCIPVDGNDFKLDSYDSLCKAISNTKGEFVFPLLPGGVYILVPRYEFNNSKFTIEPNRYEFQISSHSIDLQSKFTISGFSVKGKIISENNGSGLFNAEIYVDKKKVTKTDLNGDFIISCVNKGYHKLSVIAEGYLFNETSIKFDPKDPNIGLFYPEKISICGSIVIDTNHVQQSVLDEFTSPRKLVLINESTGDIVDSIFTNSEKIENSELRDKKSHSAISRFCFYAIPGSYIIKPVVDSTVSLSLAPNQIKIQLKSQPVTVKFSQFRGSIAGLVKCIERCNTGEFEVTLKSVDDNSVSSHFIQHILIMESQPNEGTFIFQDIVPGNYKIELISANGHSSSYKNRWCWSQLVLPVTMIDENISSGLIFEQKGFFLEVLSSHSMKIDYFHIFIGDNGEESVFSGSKTLLKGTDQICLPKSGIFKLKVDTCHKIVNDTLFVDTNVMFGSQLKLDVFQYKVRIDFVLTNGLLTTTNKNELEDDVKGLITYNLNSDPIVKAIDWKNDNVGVLEFWVEPETSIQVSAISNKYLVKPNKMNFQLPHETLECTTVIGKFELEPGTFIVGSITPPIKDAVIEVRKASVSNDEEIVKTIVISSNTDESGQFNLGPLTSSFKYDVTVVKSGYRFLKIESEIDDVHLYSSLKLAELHVEIIDNVTGSPISGILLSIIGDDVRRNELTDENGKFSFVGLTAGTYYLRAMMKELEFDPPGAIEITMAEGYLENVVIRAYRTSFSVYGKVVSLNGEPETGISVEADPIKNVVEDGKCQKNLLRNEHGTSDDTGSFRIRGLVPHCNYRLSLKINIDNSDDSGIVQSYPRFIDIKMTEKDLHSFKLYALRNMNMREISAMVWTNDESYLNSLQITVFPSGNPDNVISIHKFQTDTVYFQMNLPQVHKRVEYVIRLQSNLNPRLFSNISSQERVFVVEPDSKSFVRYFQFDFYPIKSSVLGDADVSLTVSSSILFPLFLVVMTAILYNRQSLQPPFLAVVAIISSKLALLISSHRLNSNSNNNNSGGGNSNNGNNSSPLLDAAEISELNSVIAKPKATIAPVSTKKPPFWLRPKKT